LKINNILFDFNFNHQFQPKIKLGNVDDWFKVESIYLDSFPICERQSSETIQSRISSNKLKLFVVLVSEQYLGFALVWEIKQIDSCYIEYLAVSKNDRNNGIGKFLLNSLKETLKNKKIFVEIEEINSLESSNSNKNDRLRRFEFYKKNDFNIITNVTYKMPSLINELESIPMLLLYFSKVNEKVKKEDLKLFIEFLYLSIYNKNKENSILKEIIKTIKL
jgi:ribosomal protein S18 acetylase RimI-like enzyme